MSQDEDAPEEVVWQGRFITAKRRGRWEYVGRARDIHAAVILAIIDGDVLLVEQHRAPLGGEGGGEEGEGITVHRVPLADIAAFVEEKRAEGLTMDVKLLILLGAGMVG